MENDDEGCDASLKTSLLDGSEGSRVGSGGLLLSIACYVMCSTSMLPLNKALMLAAPPNTSLALIGGQLLFAACVLGSSSPTRSGVCSRTSCAWSVIVPPVFLAMMVTSMLSLPHTTFGTNMALRATAPIVAVSLEYCVGAKCAVAAHSLLRRRDAIDEASAWQQRRDDTKGVSPRALAGLCMVLLGCVAFVWNDLRDARTTNVFGVALMSANVVFSVVDRIVQRSFLCHAQINRNALLLVTNAIAGALLAVVAGVRDEWQSVFHVSAGGSTSTTYFAVNILLPPRVAFLWLSSAVLGLCLGASGAWMQSKVCATTHLLVTLMTRVGVVIVGAVVFGDALSVVSVISLSVCMLGGSMYAFADGS